MLLAPLALLFGLSIPVLLTFYLLKVRQSEREVSSTLLWEILRRDLAAHEPWQRLRWSVLLVLQLLLLTLLTLALARPASQRPAPANRFAALIIDTSASMAATDVTPRRFDQAVAAAHQVIAQLPDGTSAALIEAGSTARVVVPETLDHGALDQGLAGLQPTDTTGDSIAAALGIARALARGRGGATVHLFSDGAFPHPSEWDDLTGLNVRFHPVGTAAANQAIVAMAMRPDPTGGTGDQLFARIENFGDAAVQTSATLRADGTTIETRPVDLPANGTAQLFFLNVPSNAKVIQLQLDQPDALAADNTATLVRSMPPTVPVLMVTRGNLFLQKALQALPGISVYQVTPRGFTSIDTSTYAVLVFDGYTPDQPPNKNALIINPTDASWLPLHQVVRDPPITLWRSDDPTLAFVDLSSIRIARASEVTLPDWAHPLIESNGIPLGFIGQNNGQRVIGLTFDLQQSNLPLSASFPIFISNVMQFLVPPSVARQDSLMPGSPAVIQIRPGVDRVVVQGPANQHWEIHPSGSSLSFTQTSLAGLYQATEYIGSQSVATQQFAVNMFSPSESDLRPRANLVDHDSASAPTPAEQRPIIHEYAPWLLLLVVPLMLGEWWWFHRR
ncbi:MAG TPA: VWA domain-containing protein [Chloroflexota bacterium]|nr:VWA domain-containing protein [Chloroflexota bacterium]